MSWYAPLLAAAEVDAQTPEKGGSRWLLFTLIALAIVALSILVGQLLAKRWRMPEYSGKFGLILFSLIASGVVVGLGWPPKLGIDLRGGVTLVYDVVGGAQAGAGATADQGGAQR